MSQDQIPGMDESKKVDDASNGAIPDWQPDFKNDEPSSKINFIEYAKSQLTPGLYQMEIEQNMEVKGKKTVFSRKVNFAASSERFNLSIDEISSVFPPHMMEGNYSGALASVALNSQTLPWDRSLSQRNVKLPWLAILIFNFEEAPSVQNLSVSDLIKNNQTISLQDGSQDKDANNMPIKGKLPAEMVSYPGLEKLDYGENATMPCKVIDIERSVFNRVAPSIADMEYLAHVRETLAFDNVLGKEVRKKFSIITANRMARKQESAPTFAFLVSLENMESHLRQDDHAPSHSNAGHTHIRLICYKSWQFINNSFDNRFSSLLTSLNQLDKLKGQHYNTLQFPTDQLAQSKESIDKALAAQEKGQLDDKQAKVLVDHAFEMGYIPIKHKMRTGSTTVSWYRGPCVPYRIENKKEKYTELIYADASSFYNPDTGLFDISYGAAWQLGQLISLKNTTYSYDLSNWKNSVNHHIIRFAAGHRADNLYKKSLGAEEHDGEDVAEHIATRRQAALDQLPTLPASVPKWLNRLAILQDIPFNYLVPHEAMLPMESIRIFYIDPNWIHYLQDGAFSINRPHRKQDKIDGVLLDHARDQGDMANRTYTGFLLRSQVVSGWPNIRVYGYATQDAPDSEVRKVRLEHLSSDCLLCIFEGEISQISINEPPEQLYCGLRSEQNNHYSVVLRQLNGDKSGIPLELKGNAVTVPIILRADDHQTICISTSAKEIDKKLRESAQKYNHFGAAEFALEIIRDAIKVNFNLKT